MLASDLAELHKIGGVGGRDSRGQAESHRTRLYIFGMLVEKLKAPPNQVSGVSRRPDDPRITTGCHCHRFFSPVRTDSRYHQVVDDANRAGLKPHANRCHEAIQLMKRRTAEHVRKDKRSVPMLEYCASAPCRVGRGLPLWRH